MTSARLSAAAFERDVLDRLCESLNRQLANGEGYADSASFEESVRERVEALVKPYGAEVDADPRPYVFPDIVVGAFGVEVKYTASDSWRSIANSVFESTRDPNVRHIYVVFGNMGERRVAWDHYSNAVIHVRTSHVPRFEVELFPDGMTRSRESLFRLMGVSYEEFARLPMEQRMRHIRAYARGRLREGEYLWWMEDRPEEPRTVPMEIRVYMDLDDSEKRKLRAEAALLFPEIVGSGRSRRKYSGPAVYLLSVRGVVCPQTRDLFSAGSVAGSERGGNYVQRALSHIEEEMRHAAANLEDALFVEYWGASVPPDQRIREWLKRSDALARGWKPSECLFLQDTRG